MNKLVDIIKQKMIEEHITEKNLSDMIGCSHSLLKKYLNEEEEIPVIITNNIKKVLNINNKEIISINDRFNNLSKVNQNKVLEYIEFLEYKEKNNSKKLELKTDY